MHYSAYEIKKLFASNFSGIDFLEEISKMERRYLENGIILFYYYEDDIKTVIKFYSLQNVPDKQIKNKIDHLNKEYEFAKRVKHHPNIVNVYRHDKIRINGMLIGLVMFMEYFPLTLKDLILRKRKFSDKEIDSFLEQIGSALETAHYKIDNPIVHCDIKPSNIGVREESHGKYHYKLMDFDVSQELDERIYQSEIGSSTGYTPGYSAPEQVKAFFNKRGIITNSIDIYSVGIIALQMHVGLSPSREANRSSIELPTNLCNRKWRTIINKLCSVNPYYRPKTIKEVLIAKKRFNIITVLMLVILLIVIAMIFGILYSYVL